MAFALKASATVEDVAITHGSGEDAETKVMVKLSIPSVSAEVAHGIIGGVNAEEVSEAFHAFFENAHSIKVGEVQELRVARIGHFVLRPRGLGVFDLTTKITIDSPPKGVIEKLAHLLKSEVPVELVNQELDLPGGSPKQPAQTGRGQAGKRNGHKQPVLDGVH